MTYEGDNNVLSQQAGNWLLRQYEAALSDSEIDSPLGTVAFLKDYRTIKDRTFNCTSTHELKNPQCEYVVYNHIYEYYNKIYMHIIRKGTKNFI